MSKPIDYSKFDHIGSDSEEEEEEKEKISRVGTVSTLPHEVVAPQQPAASHAAAVFRRKPGSSTRFVLEYEHRPIYEWEQSLEEVTLYISTPPGVTHANQLKCIIGPNRLQIGLQQKQKQQQQYFLDEPTFGTVDVSSSTWTWEDSVLTIELQKANKGVVWEAVSLGNRLVQARLDPLQLEEEKQRLMLERWQQENPGMDFRGATFNGSVPDPRSFMGGVRYD